MAPLTHPKFSVYICPCGDWIKMVTRPLHDYVDNMNHVLAEFQSVVSRLYFCAAITVPKSAFNFREDFVIPDFCLMCSPERENGLVKFLNCCLQYRFDCCYYPRCVRRLLTIQLTFKSVLYEHSFINSLC